MRNITFVLMVLSLTIISCEPEVIVGPEGPQGPAGLDGNANVVSIEKTVGSTDWIAEGSAGEDLYYYYEISVPQITQDILDDGFVIVFLKSGDYYTALPTVYYFYSSTYDYYYSTTIRYHFGPRTVRLEIQDSDLFTYRPEKTLAFKIVVIGGSVASSINLNEYSEVETLL